MRKLIRRRLLKPSEEQNITQNLRVNAKYLILKSTLVILVLLFNIVSSAQTLTIKPLKPSPGDTLIITYDVKGGKFENDTLITATAIIFDGFLQDVKKINLTKEGAFYTGKLATDSTTQFMAFGISSKKVWDNAPKDGYLFPFYQNGKIVEGAHYIMADFYLNATGKALYGFTADYKKALELIKQEQVDYPASKNRINVLQRYYQYLLKLDPERAKAEVLAQVKTIDGQQKITDFDYYTKLKLYEVLGMTEESSKTMDALYVNYPNSPIIFSKRFKEAITPRPAIQMEELGNQLIIDYNMIKGKEFNSLLSSVYSSVNQAYLQELNLPKFYFYLNKQTAGLARLSNLTSAAIFLADHNKELDHAERIGKWGLALIDSLSAPTINEIEKQKLDQKKIDLMGVLGQVYFSKQSFEEALTLLKKAHDESKVKSIQINTYYGLILVKYKDYELAKPLLEGAIRDGKTESVILQAYKEAYLNSTTKSEDYAANLDKLLVEVEKNRKAELKKIMLNKPAPDFTLMDSKGKKVALTDYRGKIVVLDFWATWCIPCLQAFPGMQKLINKYENDKDVVFLFINTAENLSKNLTKNINTYLIKNKYNFQVLIDQPQKENIKQYEVGMKYDARSIPLKVIIDKTGTIRFSSVGYLGSDELVVKELSAYIEAVRN